MAPLQQGRGFERAPYRSPTAPPAGADPQLWQWFIAVDADRSGQITAHELQTALKNGHWNAFDLDTIKHLMSMFDVDKDGTIGFDEFAGFWRYINEWRNTFKRFDKDHSNLIDSAELQTALKELKYNLSPRIITLIARRFAITNVPAPKSGRKPSTEDQENGITFDRFVRACAAVKKSTEMFHNLDTNKDGKVCVDYEGFMSIVFGIP